MYVGLLDQENGTERTDPSAQLLPPDNEVRRKHEELLLDKLYDMGILSV